MKKLLVFFLISTCLTPQSLLAGTEDFKRELDEIRAKFSPRIQELDSQNSAAIFDLTKDLSSHYKSLASKICSEVMEKHPGIQDIVSIALSGSVAWGEPTLQSDIEVVYLVRDYRNMKQVFDFALDFADEFEKIGDKHFTLDQVSTHELEENKMSILERAPAIFTIEDIEKFNFGKLSAEKIEIKNFVQHFSELMESEEDRQALLLPETIEKVSKRLAQDPVTFTHSLFNLEHLGGDASLFEAYKIHFQSVVKQMTLSFVDNLDVIETPEPWYIQINKANSQSNFQLSFKTFLWGGPSQWGDHWDHTYEGIGKAYWRVISNVVRCLGFILGANNEKGSLDTLNTLKNKTLQGKQGSSIPVLGESFYEELLDKATVFTWNRLMRSINPKHDYAPNLTEIANITVGYEESKYYKKYKGFLKASETIQ